MFCGSCGAQIKEGGKFCPVCGWKVPGSVSYETPPDGKRCASCGTVLKDGAKFCPNCGGNFFESFAVVTTSAPVQQDSAPETKGNEDDRITAAVQETPGNQGKCGGCGKPVEKEWLACPYCKAEIPRERLCASCGKKLEPEWVICPFCKTEV